jgi:hypothetical protein
MDNNRHHCPAGVFFYLLGLLFLTVPQVWSAASETAVSYTDEDCIGCHRQDSEESSLHITVEQYEASVHGQEVTCMECHTRVVDDQHQTLKGSGAVDCSECHEQENRHGQGATPQDRPRCHDCHTRHNMLGKDDPASSVHAENLPETCAACHAAESGQTGYFAWLPSIQIASHNKADFAAAYEKGNCIGCHQGKGVHGEDETIDDQDCYKCHRSAEAEGALWGYMHPKADWNLQPATFASASLYQVILIVGLIVLLGKSLDFIFDRDSGKKNNG